MVARLDTSPLSNGSHASGIAPRTAIDSNLCTPHSVKRIVIAGPCGTNGTEDPDYSVLSMPMKIAEESYYEEN